MRLHHPLWTEIPSKLSILIRVMLILFLGIILRLAYLQIHLNDLLFARSTSNFTRIMQIPPLRGNIKDCHGELLATNKPIHHLAWRGTGKRSLSTEQQKKLAAVATLVEKDFSAEEFIKTIAHCERNHQTIVLNPELTIDQLSSIQEQFPCDDNIIIKNDVKRHYPYGTYASHILGYLGSIEQHGKMGLEELCDASLQGQSGAQLKTINSTGKQLNLTELEQAQAGNDIITTINIELQTILEKHFPKDISGTAIIMNPENGDLCAVLSRPSFEPTLFLSPISQEKWEDIQRTRPFLNRAFNASYPPGSVFKLVTMSAALEHDIISTEHEYLCKGFTYFGKRKYWCHRRTGHGIITAQQALAYSCNPIFYEIAKIMPINMLADYAQRFGLGQKTNILFPEKSGLVPTKEWKMNTKGEPWWPGETLSAVIGQSFLLTTPLQVARMISGICAGYLATPRLLQEDAIQITPLNIKQETLDFLRGSMEKVVTTGTGRNISKVKDIVVYAKTSTAQNSDFSKRLLDTKYLEHGWFAGYFQYKEEKPLTIVVLTENVGSASVPTNIAKNFLTDYKRMVDAQFSI